MMSYQHVSVFAEHTDLSGTSDAMMVSPYATITCAALLKESAGQATLEYTLDSQQRILTDNATWLQATTQTGSFADFTEAPITGVRLKVQSGVWDFKVLQTEKGDS